MEIEKESKNKTSKSLRSFLQTMKWRDRRRNENAKKWLPAEERN
jgi:hypothetical protein